MDGMPTTPPTRRLQGFIAACSIANIPRTTTFDAPWYFWLVVLQSAVGIHLLTFLLLWQLRAGWRNVIARKQRLLYI